MVVGLVCGADRSDGVGAVELVVGHIVESSQLAAKGIETVNSDVDYSFGFFDEISAHNVPSIISVDFISDPEEITVGILS